MSFSINFDDDFDEKFNIFLSKYQNQYPISVLEYIKKKLKLPLKDTGHLLRQVYTEMGVIPFEFDIYKIIADKINSIYRVEEKNLLDVGGGYLPIQGEHLKSLQTTGTTTVMDKLIIPISNGNVIANQSFFNEHTNIEKYDLICSVSLCDYTIPFVEAVCSKETELFTVICGCSHHLQGNPKEHTLEGYINWRNAIYFAAKRTLSPDFEILTSTIEDPIIDGNVLDVIYTKKRPKC